MLSQTFKNIECDLRILFWDKVGIDTRKKDCHITVVGSIVIQLNISNSQRFVQWVHTVLSPWSSGIKTLNSFPPMECVELSQCSHCYGAIYCDGLSHFHGVLCWNAGAWLWVG